MYAIALAFLPLAQTDSSAREIEKFVRHNLSDFREEGYNPIADLGAEAVPLVIKIVREPDQPEQRKHGLGMLTHPHLAPHGDPAELYRLAAPFLKSHDYRLRERAARLLLFAEDEAIPDDLIGLLEVGHPLDLETALDVLAIKGTEASVEKILDYAELWEKDKTKITSPDRARLAADFIRLRTSSDPGRSESIIQIILDRDAPIATRHRRRWAITYAWKSGDPTFHEPLHAVAADEMEWHATMAAVALLRMGADLTDREKMLLRSNHYTK